MKFKVSFAYLTSNGWRTHEMTVVADNSTHAEQTVREQMTGYSVMQIKSVDVVTEEVPVVEVVPPVEVKKATL